jgi:copper chaperone CopZ
MASHTFTVPNISCEHCVRRITQALTAVPGVQSVRADVESKQVIVAYEGASTLEQARRTLRDIGYPPAE